jgi:U3 small nucleolar RNA-associated protein 20
VRDAPLDGHGSFIAEEVALRKDTTGAKHWNETVHAINDYIQSLELVSLHKHTILSILLEQAGPAAKASIPALASVIAAFAKDLQADFVPFLPRVCEHLAGLATSFVRDPECLEAIFSNVSSLLKSIHKHLLHKLPWVFKVSRSLRYHDAQHVRVFAAEVRCLHLRGHVTNSSVQSLKGPAAVLVLA